eukprot:scpid91395/ scgid25989/ 
MAGINEESFLGLHMGCPALNCDNRSNKDVVRNRWASKECNGMMWISQKGNLRCVHHHATRPCVYGPVNSFKFDCGLRGQGSPHSLQEPFVATNPQSICHAVAVALAMGYFGSGVMPWSTELMGNLVEQFPDEPSASVRQNVRRMTLVPVAD